MTVVLDVRSKYVLCFFLALFVFPIKALTLVVLPIWVLFELLARKIDVRVASFVLFFMLLNLIVTIASNGSDFVLNYLLFYLFVSPILLMVLSKSCSREFDFQDSKKIIEYFLWVQISFSVASGGIRFLSGWGFDLNFGDVIAGTLRNPFDYKSDASNVMFVYMMILTMSLYIFKFGSAVNKFLVVLVALVIFLASVNHLVLSTFLAISVLILFENPKRGFWVALAGGGIFLFFIFLYGHLQATNYMLIQERVVEISSIFTGGLSLEDVGFKGQYLAYFFQDCIEEIYGCVFVGNGAGIYSSRAALFLTGEYVPGFNISNISELMMGNTYPLWLELKSAPPWLAGAYNFPYSSFTSFIFEVGFIFSVTLIYMLSKVVARATGRSKSFYFYFTFFMISGMVDNYWEYYQVFAVVAIFVSILKTARTELETV